MAVRFAEALMPKVANGIHLDADLARAHSENVELELHRKRFCRNSEGTLRLLSFANQANMGSYRQAVDNFLTGGPRRRKLRHTRYRPPRSMASASISSSH